MRSLFVLIFLVSSNAFAQISDYLENNTIDLDAKELFFNTAFYDNQVFFFGFIHGSGTPQVMDFRMLKHLHSKGVKYYAPEVGVSLAFFLNKYLESGDEHLLNFIVHCYASRVPQDASLQFKNKWRKIYKLNQSYSDKNKLQIIGFDQKLSNRLLAKELALTHLAFLSKDIKSDNAIIVNLKKFSEIRFSQVDIKSGRPVWKSGKDWDYFFGNDKSRYFDKLQEQFNKDPDSITKVFGRHNKVVNEIFAKKLVDRESAMFKNFLERGQPIIDRGEKIYCNYGYYHIQQGMVNKQMPFAARIKKNTDNKIATIQGILYDSECLKAPKWCFDRKINIKGVKFEKVKYCGYTTSKTWDGDSFFERVNGIKYLKRLLKNNSSALITLENEGSPFKNQMYFANYKKGGRRWKVEPDAATTDYFQYIILMKNSKANIPYLEEL